MPASPWVGPAPHIIAALGDKVEARRIAAKVGAPLVKGSDGRLPRRQRPSPSPKPVGLPLTVKAAFGGGGRGMSRENPWKKSASFSDPPCVRRPKPSVEEIYAEQFLDNRVISSARLLPTATENTSF